MLIISTSAKHSKLDKVVRPLIEHSQVSALVVEPDHLMDLDADKYAGSTQLLMGSAAFGLLATAGLVKKKQKMGGSRENLYQLYGRPTLVTYDVGILDFMPELEPDLKWDVNLAIRYALKGTLAPITGSYQYVSDFVEVIAWSNTLPQDEIAPITLDLETQGLDEFAGDGRILTIQISYQPGHSLVYRMPADGIMPRHIYGHLNQLFHLPWLNTVGANLKYDMRWLWKHSQLVRCNDLNNQESVVEAREPLVIDNHRFDTQLVGGLLNENRFNSLKSHIKEYAAALGGYEDQFEAAHDKADMSTALNKDPEGFLVYAGGDTDGCLRIYPRLKKEIVKDPALARFYTRLLHPAATAFRVLESRGIVIDRSRYLELQKLAEAERDKLHIDCFAMMPNKIKYKYADNLKLTRDAIIRDFLFSPTGLNIKPLMYTEGSEKRVSEGKDAQESTAWEHLKNFIDHKEAGPFVKLLKQYNATCKTVDTYIVGFLSHLRSDGRFHPSYILAKGGQAGDEDEGGGTNTGRSSCKDPAYQCVIGSTQILTRVGWRSALDIVIDKETGGTPQVLSHRGRMTPVAAVHRNGTRPVFRVTTESGWELVCTENHPLLTGAGFVRADHLQLGDYVFTIGSYGKVKAWSLPEKQNEDISDLGRHARKMPNPQRNEFPMVRWAWNQGLRTLDSVSKFLGGYDGSAGRSDDRTQRSRWRLLPGELLLEAKRRNESQQKKQSPADVSGEDSTHRSVGAGIGVGGSVKTSYTEGLVSGSGTFDGNTAYAAGFELERIVAIEYRGDQETYDLSVVDDHSFIADGVVVHNTWPKRTAWAKRLRTVVICPPGYRIAKGDMSQGELRLMADASNCKNMIEAYRKGLDLHAVTGAHFKGMTIEQLMTLPDDQIELIRYGAKAGNFGLIYRISPEGYRQFAETSYGVKLTSAQAEHDHQSFFKLYPEIRDYHDLQVTNAKKQGWVRNPLGRVRHLPLINSRDGSIRGKQERQAINAPGQSALFDMMMLLMVQITKYRPDLWMFGNTHDSLELYVREDTWQDDLRQIKELAENLPLTDFGWKPRVPFIMDFELSKPAPLGNLGETEKVILKEGVWVDKKGNPIT